MKTLTSALMLLMLLVSQPLLAHGDHKHHDSPEASTKMIAQAVAKDLALHDGQLGFGQLPESWSKVPSKNISISKQDNGKQVVSVLNEVEQKTLYILMSDENEVLETNLTGDFERLN